MVADTAWELRLMSLRYVDPVASRGRLYRAYARVFGSGRVALWLSRHIGWKVDPVLMRLSGGRLGFGLMIPTALLETRGARSGRVRRNVVIYFHDGDRVTLMPAKAGAPSNPAWYHNARSHPDVIFGGERFRAEVVDDESERARLWELADRVFAPYAAFRAKAARAGRTIPIIQLVPSSVSAFHAEDEW
jgi:deazaflavin-dependent oxidoreductase (nitroreductase family)